MLVSIGNKVKRIAGLLGTQDLTEWETRFVDSITDSTDTGANCSQLSAKQIDIVTKIWEKHFA